MKIKVDVCGPVMAEISTDDIVQAVIAQCNGGTATVSELISIITRIPDSYIEYLLPVTRKRIAEILEKEAARHKGEFTK